MAKNKRKDGNGPPPDYDVGYGKPPAHSQFKKGQSGNPNGRPKGSANLATTLRRTLNEKVTIVENGRQKVVSKGEAAIKQLVNRSAQGELGFVRLLLPAMVAADNAQAADSGKAPADLTDQSILAPLLENISRRGHLILSSPSSLSSPANPDDTADASIPGELSTPEN